MHIRSFDWDQKNESHITKHGVSAFEVEEAILFDKPFYMKGKEGKYIAYALTDEGRYLLIVFITKHSGNIRVITARDMTPTEKHFYKKKRR